MKHIGKGDLLNCRILLQDRFELDNSDYKKLIPCSLVLNPVNELNEYKSYSTACRSELEQLHNHRNKIMVKDAFYGLTCGIILKESMYGLRFLHNTSFNIAGATLEAINQ